MNAALQLGITMKMRMAWALCIAILLLMCSPQSTAVDGTFRGRVIDPPSNQPLAPGWIFVQGRNRMLRRVEVAHALIVFGDEIPVRQRHKCDSDCLSAGQEVRVTARQDSAGEWRAKLVEILRLPAQDARIPGKPNLYQSLHQDSLCTGQPAGLNVHLTIHGRNLTLGT